MTDYATIRNAVVNAISPPRVIHRDGEVILHDTHRVIQLVRPVAEDELRRNGWDPATITNPIDLLLVGPKRHPLEAKLKRAVEMAQHTTAFGEPPPPHTIQAGDRVILATQPDAHHGFPTAIRVGTRGTARNPDGEYWQVTWDDGHGAWYAPLINLERL